MMDVDLFFLIVASIFLLLTTITFLFTSTTILVLIDHCKSNSPSIRNLLTCNSCSALLFVCLSTTIEVSSIYSHENRKERKNATNLFCKIRAWIYFSSCAIYAYSFLIQAVSRYCLTVLHRHRVLATRRINSILIISNWLLGGSIGILMFISPSSYQYEWQSRMCLLTSQYFPSAFIGIILVFFIPLQIIVVLYQKILRSVVSPSNPSDRFHQLRLKRSLKVFRNIFQILLTFIIGGTPYFLSVIISPYWTVPWPFYSFSIISISLSATIESVMIFFNTKEIRRAMGKMRNSSTSSAYRL